jgi:uncharacterized protein (TIGR03083 family)
VSGRASFDLAAVYRETQDRLLALAPRLSDDQLATMTPTCPEWSVQDVYAHLTGLAAEVVDGRVEDRGSPQRTAVQVGSRRSMTIAEICDEWRGLAEPITELIAASGRFLMPLVIDVWTHEQDIANAARVASGRDGAGLFVTMNAVWAMKAKLRDAGVAPLRVVAGRADWVIGDREPAATVRLSEYEMARAVLGRRSVRQLEGYAWEGDPKPYLAHLPVFDPPPYDIVE